MGANGSHQVDLIRWWCGEIKSVFGQALTIVKDRIDKNSKEKWQGQDFISRRKMGLILGGYIRPANVTQILGYVALI